jgi:hypothetical protein
MTTGSLVPGNLISGNISTGNIVSGSHNMATNPLTCGNISVGGISAGSLNTNYLSTGTMTLGNVFASSLVVSNITTGAVAYYVGINAGANPLTAGNLTVGTVVCSTLNMSANSLTVGNISAGAIVTGPIYAAPGAYSLIAGSASVGNITSTLGPRSIGTNPLTCGAISVNQILASTIGIGYTSPNFNIDVNGSIGANNFYLNNILVSTPTLDGTTRNRAAPSAKFIQQAYKITTDGVYWINLPTVGPTQIYCIMNPDVGGGGWMMAMKATRGTTFQYSSNYWTTNNNLNTSDTTRSNADAKFDTFNYFPATDWMAIFPDAGYNGGDLLSGLGLAWTWIELNAVNMAIPPSTWFSYGIQYTKLNNGVGYYQTNPTPSASSKYNSSIWTSQTGFQWYGFNYTSSNNPANNNVRWGWGWNDQTDQNSNDVRGGIGMGFPYSAGDNASGAGGGGTTVGLNRSMRFEMYVR